MQRRFGRAAPAGGEVLIEVRHIGSQVRVAAIDADTGTEVIVPGPLRCSVDALSRLAVRKLTHVLAKQKTARKRPFFS